MEKTLMTRSELLTLLRYHSNYQFGPDLDRIIQICEALRTAPDKIEDLGNTARLPIETPRPDVA